MGTLIRINGIIFLLNILFSTSSFAYKKDTLRDDQISKNHSANPQYERLQNALQSLYEIQKKGGWPKIIATQKFYLKGQNAPAIKQIKQRLKVTGDFTSDDTSSVFTEELVAAVQRVQKRYGYRQNGVVDALLIKQLNVPVEQRIQQLLVNMQRFQTANASGGTQLVVNIPEYKLHVYESDQHIFDMDVVVGSEEHKTVMFNDKMTNIVFSPYWNIPESIVENEMLPAMNRNKNYLRNNGYEVTGYENGLPVIRQKPGPQNSLGQVKFVFPNEHGIYFHDTPAKGLFQYPKRTFSHGCIRLADPAKLAEYLLKSSPGWNADKIKKAMNSGKEQSVKLPKPVAVAIVYYTAWVDDTGLLQLRQDIYGLDRSASNNVASR
ncbi:MAG TPA: L,D-transpeptidase family protein [Flavisolibacter sp.]|jgi:murein L,D-transpeptidase YcbB/YkuD|nr:L,D-transpeptidase family protein [Flavisolibacter sp.]